MVFTPQGKLLLVCLEESSFSFRLRVEKYLTFILIQFVFVRFECKFIL